MLGRVNSIGSRYEKYETEKTCQSHDKLNIEKHNQQDLGKCHSHISSFISCQTEALTHLAQRSSRGVPRTATLQHLPNSDTSSKTPKFSFKFHRIWPPAVAPFPGPERGEDRTAAENPHGDGDLQISSNRRGTRKGRSRAFVCRR
jgi:hypothetical protein